MTFGDVLAAIALLVAVVASLCCTTVVVALVGKKKVQLGVERLAANPIRSALHGIVVFVIGLFFLIQFESTTLAPVKFLFAFLFLFPALCALLGSAVLTQTIANRLYPERQDEPTFHELFRASLLCLGASLAPLIGWLLVAPILLLICFGSGAGVILAKVRPLQVPSVGHENKELIA